MLAAIATNHCKLIEHDKEIVCETADSSSQARTWYLTRADLACLEFGQYLNEAVVTSTIHHWLGLPDHGVYVMCTHVYETLASAGQYSSAPFQQRAKAFYKTVLPKQVDILDKNLVLFPIMAGTHWSLVLAHLALPSNPSGIPALKLFALNSLDGHHSKDELRNYIAFFFSLLWHQRGKPKQEPVPMTEGVDHEPCEVEVDVQNPIRPVYDPEGVTLFGSVPITQVEVKPQGDGFNCGIHLLRNCELLLGLGKEILTRIDQAGTFSDPGFEPGQYRSEIFKILKSKV